LPGSQNTFIYVMGSPVALVDPYGLWPSIPKPIKSFGKAISGAADKVAEPVVLTLDATAVGFQAASAVITDASTVAGCIQGATLGAGAGAVGVIGGCVAGGIAGYALGYAATYGFRLIAYGASAASVAVGCVDNAIETGKESLGEFLKGCGRSALNFSVTTPRTEPNVGLGIDIYQFGIDLGVW
jgi:hypothetical protein